MKTHVTTVALYMGGVEIPAGTPVDPKDPAFKYLKHVLAEAGTRAARERLASIIAMAPGAPEPEKKTKPVRRRRKVVSDG